MSDFWIDYRDENNRKMTESISLCGLFPKNLDMFRERIIREHKEAGHTITSINCKPYNENESQEEHF